MAEQHPDGGSNPLDPFPATDPRQGVIPFPELIDPDAPSPAPVQAGYAGDPPPLPVAERSLPQTPRKAGGAVPAPGGVARTMGALVPWGHRVAGRWVALREGRSGQRLAPLWGPAWSMFLLAPPRDTATLRYPFWLLVLAVAWLGVLNLLDPVRRASIGSEQGTGWMVAIGIALMVSVIGQFVAQWWLRRWLRRSPRWDGRGPVFRLLVASRLVPDSLALLLVALGAPDAFAFLLLLYGLVVTRQAVRAAFPAIGPIRATLGVLVGYVMGVLAILLTVLLWWGYRWWVGV